MNKVILMGRLTRDPEVRYSQGETPLAIARYSLAVDRRNARSNNGGDEEEAVDDHSLTDNSEDMPNLHKQFIPPRRPKL